MRLVLITTMATRDRSYAVDRPRYSEQRHRSSALLLWGVCRVDVGTLVIGDMQE